LSASEDTVLSAFEAPGAEGRTLRGDRSGSGPPIVQLHGLTAGRRYVTHGSKLLSRRGFEQIAYDARGHGESDPAPGDGGYSYPELSADLGSVLDEELAGRPVVLAGH
jgi:pimeloyl-ACP methyl ester carboxylesterase